MHMAPLESNVFYLQYIPQIMHIICDWIWFCGDVQVIVTHILKGHSIHTATTKRFP